jgi:hypothetical protein
MKTRSHQVFREIEKELSTLLFFGVPLGATLNDILANLLLSCQGSWHWKTRWVNRALMVRHWLYPRRTKNPSPFPPGAILVAWLEGTPRLTGLVLPVLYALKGDLCAVLCGALDVAPLVPAGVSCINWDQVQVYAVQDWRSEYRRCRPEWAAKIKSLCRQLDLPAGAFEKLLFALMIASQHVTGCIAFLKKTRPAAIVTDFDRNNKWSCLVLAARLLGIPTVTLVHGVMYEDALFFSPVLADTIVCWGEFDRKKLLAAGEPLEKAVIGGCPRLSRDLSATTDQGRRKLSLDPKKPVVMYATAPELQRLELTELFCRAVEELDFVSGVVRLHPAEQLATYGAILQRHPRVNFFENSAATLDEAFASADVVVVHSSGVGSDALVKRRPAVVLDFDASPAAGPGGDLIRHAGCPHARTAGELAAIVRRILLDEPFRRQLALAAEQFVERFCSAYGEESARLTAAIVRQAAKPPEKGRSAK